MFPNPPIRKLAHPDETFSHSYEGVPKQQCVQSDGRADHRPLESASIVSDDAPLMHTLIQSDLNLSFFCAEGAEAHTDSVCAM